MNYLHDNRLYACSFMSDLYSCKIQVIRRWNNSLSITFLVLNSLILYNHYIHFISQKHVMELEKVKAEIRELEEKAETLRPNSFVSTRNYYNSITGWLEYLNFLKCAIRWKQQLEKIIEKAMNQKDD